MRRNLVQDSAKKRNVKDGEFIVSIFRPRRIFRERKKEKRKTLFRYFFFPEAGSRYNGTVLRVGKYRRTRDWNLCRHPWYTRTKAPMPIKCRFLRSRPSSLWVTRHYKLRHLVSYFKFSTVKKFVKCYPFTVRHWIPILSRAIDNRTRVFTFEYVRNELNLFNLYFLVNTTKA